MYLTYLFPTFVGIGVGTFIHYKNGCQGFIGPIPLPFLISDVKNSCKSIMRSRFLSNLFLLKYEFWKSFCKILQTIACGFKLILPAKFEA